MIKITVNTDKAIRKLQRVSPILFEKIKEYTVKRLEYYKNELRRYIEDQKGNWVPLNVTYLQHKQALGLDERILIATGNYINSFKVVVNGNQIGIAAEGYEELGKWLEYGTSRMPARPHWSHIDLQIRYTLANQVKQYMRTIAPHTTKRY